MIIYKHLETRTEKQCVPVAIMAMLLLSGICMVITTSMQIAHAQSKGGFTSVQRRMSASALKAPMATSGDNVYVAWWSNKTGNDEVMFKASTDNGKTFGNKMNLSNSPNTQSQDAQIAASGNNVYVTWWERNATSNEPVLRVSNDNGKTFGEKIMLSNNATTTTKP
jgi:hypothetical protein